MVDEATIEIIAEPPPYMLFVRWTKFSISIDGELGRFSWGERSFAVAPGTHVVVVGAGTAFGSKATCTVSVAANEWLRLRYKPRLLKHLTGILEVETLPMARSRPR